jgi:hypothetical protein
MGKAYASLLPRPVRSGFPSLVHAYAELSQAIHAANSDNELFSKVLGNVEKHFEARRVYGVVEPAAAKSENKFDD